MRKAIIDSSPHERALSQARARIEAELANRRGKVQRSLDSAHLEQAFQHHIDQYGNDGLIRMALLLRLKEIGHVQQSDIDLLNHLPFNISYTIPEVPVRARTGQKVRYPRIKLHTLWKKLTEYGELDDSRKERIQKMEALKNLVDTFASSLGPGGTQFHIINDFVDKYEKLHDDLNQGKIFDDEFLMQKRDLVENLFLQFPQLFKNSYKDHPNISSTVQEILDAKRKGINIDDLPKHVNLQHIRDAVAESFPEMSINRVIARTKEYREAIEKTKTLIDKFTENNKLSPSFLDTIQGLYEKHTSPPRAKEDGFTMPIPWGYIDPARSSADDYMYFPTRVKHISYQGFMGQYNPLRPGLKTTVVDWMKRFRPEFGRNHGPYDTAYHASLSPGTYGILDPKFFLNGHQHYGIGLYMSTIPYLARTIGRSNARLFAKIFIPKTMKLLENDKDYGSTPEGQELLKKISTYFDNLCTKMGMSHLHGTFSTALHAVLNSDPGMRWIDGMPQIDPIGEGQRRRDELTDRMGHRGMNEINALLHRGPEPYDPINRTTGGFKPPEHKIYIGTNLDGTKSMAVPGWALHRAIKLGFEMLGAPNSSSWAHRFTNVGSSIVANPKRTIDQEHEENFPWRNSSYHAGLLLSSLGFHGYKHYDPETDNMLKVIGHPPEGNQFGVNVDHEAGLRGAYLGKIKKNLQKIAKSIVLFPSAISDLPAVRWSLARTASDESEGTDASRAALDRPMHVPGIPATRGERGRFTTGAPPESITPRGPVRLRSGPIPRIDRP